MAEVLQCPQCPLKFATKSELETHLALDHPGRDRKEVRGEEDEADQNASPGEKR